MLTTNAERVKKCKEKQAAAGVQINCYISSAAHEKLKEQAATLDLSQADVISALLLTSGKGLASDTEPLLKLVNLYAKENKRLKLELSKLTKPLPT